MLQQAARPGLRVTACLAVALVATVGLAACGEESETQSLTYTLSGSGQDAALSGPERAETGLAEITLRNDGKGDGELQLIRAEGDRSASEVIKGLEAATNGKPFPQWFFAGGGVGTTPAGESQTVTQVLAPGTYYAFNTEGELPDPGSVPALEVSGDASEETVDADETIDAFEYGFEAEPLSSGRIEVAFENSGAQPHHLLAARLKGNSTAEDVEQAFESEEGQPPFDEKGFQSTAVLEGGEAQLVTLDLEPGRYALFCFISDRQGGPPHALKGMVDEVDVE